jgi:hypothetical protein
MRELVRTIRKLEKAVIQKSEKRVRDGTGARGDWKIRKSTALRRG